MNVRTVNWIVASLVLAGLAVGAEGPAPMKVADTTITPRFEYARQEFDALHRKGGPRVAWLAVLGENRWSSDWLRLRVPAAYRFKPVSGLGLIKAVAAAGRLKEVL